VKFMNARRRSPDDSRIRQPFFGECTLLDSLGHTRPSLLYPRACPSSSSSFDVGPYDSIGEHSFDFTEGIEELGSARRYVTVVQPARLDLSPKLGV
jgi:hypothetical protein